ncbi:MAG TPA: glycogen debranching protein [Verrucomicrobia bacterium]|nr:glycogen debranching protein [Verrucomicrobiota bacterium]
MFDVARVPFSYHGSWMSISIPSGKTELFFRNHHFKSHDLFTLQTLVDGNLVTPVIKASASALVLETGAGCVEICFEGPDSVRLRGQGGGVLRLACKRNHAYGNGPGMAVFNFRRAYRRYQFESLRGSLALKGAYASEAEDLDNLAEIKGDGVLKNVEQGMQAIIISPDAAGVWELAIDEFWSSWRRPVRKAFDACMAAAAEAFETFRQRLPAVSPALASAQALAAYIDWSCTVNPTGLIKRPTLFMSKNWMDNVWSWDQCFNAMALASGHPQLALDQMLTEVDHQDDFGSYPDAFNDLEIHYNFSKPPVHGLAFSEILARLPAPPSREVMESMVVSLGKQADWWMTYRVMQSVPGDPASGVGGRASSLDGLPYYLHGNDSGWDNSTMFARGVPLVAPDLSALLVVQMDVLARWSAELGWAEAAAAWAQRAEALFATLMRELWCEDHFVARLAHDGTAVESMSLIPWLPLVLGERLPETVRGCLRRGIERHLTEWGLATERVDSPDYSEDGYWRGPIWAPSTFLAVTGLERSGHGDLAAVIADRFCKLCAKSGFAENYNAITGAPLRDPAYTWTASVFLLLAGRKA